MQGQPMSILRKPVTITKLAVRKGLLLLTSPRVAFLFGEAIFQLLSMRQSQGNIDLLQVKRVLVVRLDEIGDVVITTPFLRELRRNVPDAWITLVVKPAVYNLVELCPYVNEVLTYDWNVSRYLGPLQRYWRALRLAYRYLWQRRFDLAIVPRWDSDYYHATFVAYFSGAPWRVGYSEHVTRDKEVYNKGYDRFFTHVLNSGRNRHEVVRNLEVLRFMGGKVEEDNLEVWLSKEDEGFVECLLKAHGLLDGFLVAFGPGAGAHKRIWPVERFVEVGKWLEEMYDARIVIVGRSDERHLGETLKQGLGNGSVVDLVGSTTLRQVGAILKRSHLFIGNDTGLMHVAAALKVPVVEISCHSRDSSPDHCNSPQRFGPWKVLHAVLQPEKSISPCSDGCFSSEAHCILSVSVGQVKKAIEKLIKHSKGWDGPKGGKNVIN